MTTPTDDLKVSTCTLCDMLHEYSPEKHAHLEAMTRVGGLPYELQTNIAKFCDMRSLAILSRMGKEWNRRAIPLLWSNLDFFKDYDDRQRGAATAKFFLQCSKMMQGDPERFAKLAVYVRVLNVGRMFGIIISDILDESSWIDDDIGEQQPCVFDVIARFTNLESLSIYVKSWWGYGPQREDAGMAISQNLLKLRTLNIGGQVPPFILQGFASLAHQITDLALINLISVPGQVEGPEPVTFLSEEDCARFANLQSLHLCKLADLDPRRGRQHNLDDSEDDDNDDDWDGDYISGMRWDFPRDGEALLLQEWALLLRHTSKTLRSLKLENRYLCAYQWSDYQDDFIEPGTKHPDDYGAVSIRQSQRTLFPVFFNQEWPELMDLTLVGMGMSRAVDESIAHLKDRVRVEQSPARIQIIQGDCTPEEISTPCEFKDVCERVVWGDVEQENEGSE